MAEQNRWFGWRYGLSLLGIVISATICMAQGATAFRYTYDDAGRLVKAIDANGKEVDYSYDSVGNLVRVTKGSAPGSKALAIIDFVPESGLASTTVILQGQNFSSTPTSDAVTFNGAPATVTSATSTTLTAIVPATATTGPITVKVGSDTATSSTNFTVTSTPFLQTITPRTAVSGTQPVAIASLQVTGSNLLGSTFSFAPAFVPAAVTVNSAIIDPTGTSATLNVTVAAGASGTYTLLATNASGTSSVIATDTNSLRILSPGNDDDGDGLTNSVEAALGTDPLNPTTSGTGLPDGWQVFYGFNPLDPSVASQDPDHSGLTVLQDFQQGLSPRNPNRVPPAVSQVSPKNGATAVTINGSVVVRFAEPLLTGTTLSSAQAAIAASLPANTTLSAAARAVAAQDLQAYMNRTCCGNSVVPGTVTLTGPAGGVAGSVTPSSDGLSAVFGPTTPLSANTTYTVVAQGVKDAAGNLMTVPFTSSFTTGSLFDGTAPVVKVVDPENGLTNVPTNVHYEIEFSKVMDPSTLTPTNVAMFDRTANAAVAGMVQVDASGMTASFVPSQPLLIAHAYSVSLTTAIKDINGNYLASPATYYFSAGVSAETTPPHLVATSPENGATGVALNAIIDLLFNEPIAIPSVVPNIQVMSNGQPVAFMAALSNGDQRVTLTPASPFQPGATYTVIIGGGVSDLAAMGLDNPGSFTFQTGTAADTSAFNVTAVDPSNKLTNVPVNVMLHLLFNKPVDGAAFGSANLLLYPSSVGGAEAVKGKLEFATDRTSVTMIPASPLSQETQYCVYVTGVIDAQGHGLAQNGQNLSCFTTGVNVMGTPLTVVATTPVAGATGMPVNTLIQAQLSGPISVVSANAGGITLTAGGVSFPGTITASADATLLTFTPSGFLAVNTVYTLHLGGFTDLAGNAVTPFTSTFNTSASALTMNVNLSTGLDKTGNVITTGNVPDGHWVVTPTAATPPAGTYSVGGQTQPLLTAASGDVGFPSGTWPIDGPDSSWITINPDSIRGNTFGVYSTNFNVPGTSVPTNLCLVGAMGVDDNGQLAINGKAIMGMISSITSLTSLNIPISSYLVPGANTLSLGWGANDNYYEGFRLQAVIENCGGTDTASSLTVNSITPAGGSTGVSVTTPVVVVFNEAVNPLTVNASSVSVRVNGDPVAGDYAVNGGTVTFTPLSPLPGSATVTVLVDSYALVQDLVGRSGSSATSSFTTAAVIDTSAPKVVAVTPQKGATGIGSNGQVALTFSKSMNPATLLACCTTGYYSNVELLAGEARLGFTATVSADNRMLTLSNVNLPPSTVITVVVTHGATDLSGNALVDFASQFTTGPAISTSHASVVNQRPANGATGVDASTSPIVLYLNTQLNAGTISGALHIAQNGQPVSGSIQLAGGGQAVEFTPSEPLSYGALVQVFLDATAEDISGNTVSAYQSSFKTGSDPATTAPALVNLSPANGATNIPTNTVIDFQFNEKLDPTSINSSFMGNLAGKVTLDPTGYVIKLAPALPLNANVRYCFYVQSVKALNGLASPFYETCFTTGANTQSIAPVITSVSPVDKLSGVPVNARAGLLFSGPIDPTSASSTSIQLRYGGKTVVPASFGFANSNQTIELSPMAALPASTQMTLTVSGLTDVAGNPIATLTTHFSTGTSPSLATPYVTAENPEYQATGVPLNAFVSLNATGELDSTTINSNSFYVLDTVTNKEITGTYSLSTDALTAYFVPSVPLPASRRINVYFNGRGITDLAGNGLSCCANTLGDFYFVTGTTASTSAPLVTAVSPSNRLKQVPTNAQVVVVFNEPVDVESLSQITLTGGGGTVPFTSTLSAGNQTLTLVPSVAFSPGLVYTLTIAGVTDLSGNKMTPFTSSFSTALDPDFVQPAVVLFDPANGLSGVPLNTQVRLRFNKPVDAALFGAGNVMLYPRSVGGAIFLTGKVVLSSDATSVTMTPAKPLLEETQYCIYLTGIVDDEGQGLAQNNQTPGCFTTGTTDSTSAPSIVGVSPVSGATGVPVKALVELQVGSPISGVSVVADSLAISSGGVLVPGSVVSTSPTTILFTPTSPLSAGTNYTVTAGGFTDLAGNPAVSFSSQFTTSSTVASAGPLQVASITPLNGATGVAVTAPIQVVFNEAVNPLTISDLSVNVQTQGSTLAGNYAVNGATVIFTPSSPLPGGTAVRVLVNNYGSVLDLSGNAGQFAGATFTTAPTLDTTIPNVVSVTPLNGATGIGLNGQVVLTFSKSMNPATLLACCTTGYYSNLELLAGDTRLSFTATISADNRSLTLSGLSLPASQVITVVVTHGATDLSGNALADFTSQFTTGSAFDTTHASVVTQRPGNAATGVSINASPVVIFLNKPVSPTTVAGAMHVSQNGQVVPGTVSVVGNGQTIDFTPASPWEYGALVEPFLDATASDTTGLSVNAFRGTFTTVGNPATTAPALVSYSPLSGATKVPTNAIIEFQFNQKIDPATINPTFLGGVVGTTSLDPTGYIIRITPKALLTAGSRYCVYTAGEKGLNGLAIPYEETCFYAGTGPQTTAPSLALVSPTDKLSGVPINARVSLVFSGPIDPISVSGATVQLTGGGQTLFPASISFTNSNQTVIVTPYAPLPAATLMTLTISGVTDIAGNPLATQTTRFTTGGAPALVSPYVIAESPEYQATGVPVNAFVSINATEEIDPSTINSGSFYVYDTVLGKAVAGNYSLSADTLTAYFVPSAPFAPSRQYNVYFNNRGMTDLAGNLLTCCSGTLGDFYYTTGTGSSTTAPQVNAISPSSGFKQVPTNARVVILFNEPVDVETLNQITLTGGGNTVPLASALSGGNQTLVLTPSVTFAPNTLYTLTAAGITDLSGNKLKAPFSSSFTTAVDPDYVQPAVISVSPTNGVTAVPSATVVQVQFNKPMNALSITNSTFTLSLNGNTLVPGTLAIDPTGLVATFKPNAALALSSSYTVRLTGGVTDLEGLAIPAVGSTFTTGTQ